MKERWVWITRSPQIIRDITWQLEQLAKTDKKLKELANAETEEEKSAKDKAEKKKNECLEKIKKWKKTYPFEAKQLDQHLIELSQKKKPHILNILNRREKPIEIEHIIKTI